jgi:hypothetical protein
MCILSISVILHSIVLCVIVCCVCSLCCHHVGYFLLLFHVYFFHTQIYPILIQQQITAYFRYVDILIIYDQNKTSIDHTLNEFNKLQQTIKFTIEKEQESINFLDIRIHRKYKNLQYSIYRKPIQTDIIIPKNSCHPYEPKISGINYLLRRLHT